MNIKDFLNQPDIKAMIADNDLQAVYLNLSKIERGDLSEYLLKRGIDPVDYFIGYIPEGAFFQCKDLGRVEIPDTVARIGERAFSSCPNLTSIVIPASVTNIDDCAFYKSYDLASVTFAEGSKLTNIGRNAFYSCQSLESITIPDKITNIDYYAFERCTNLTSVVIPESVTTIGYAAFYDCDSLTDVYYAGSKEQWKAITIEFCNNELIEAKIHFNS